MALPPAASPGDGRSPIFESLESDWFRRQAAERGEAPRAAAVPEPAEEPRPDTGAPAQTSAFPGGSAFGGGSAFSGGSAFGSGAGTGAASGSRFSGMRRVAPQPVAPQPPAPQPAAPQPPAPRPPQPEAPQRARAEEEWRPSPNDERWRRAEQVKEPAAGGITPSGLPRRVPRANLVPGTAQQTPQTGPQVSRAPDDVRGRLTNLRRGIQQGRTAGSGPGRPDDHDPGGYRSGTTHQQER
jgi:hypothetical protein